MVYADISIAQTNQDTLINISEDNISTEDTKVKEKSKIGSFFNIFSGKPGRAALYSLLIPGGGQLYNRKYWKVPIAAGVEGFLFYRVIRASQKYNGYKRAYLRFQEGKIFHYNGHTSADHIKSFRDKYQLEKESAIVYLTLAHLLSVIEAFVNRHLMEFDMSDDLTIDMKSEILTPQTIPIEYVGMQLTYKF